jgi:putative FmdB family regulatory protein
MAYYEFCCKECETTFTVHENIAEHEKHKHPCCPECRSKKTVQQISPFFAKTASKT